MPKICSVGGCTNHHMQKENLSFFKFPDAGKDPERRARWVRACGRQNHDGSEWIPLAKYDYICRQHFISGKPNSDPDHPDYISSIYLMTTYSSLNGAMRPSRYDSAQKSRLVLAEDSNAGKRRKIEYEENDEEKGETDESLNASGVEIMMGSDDKDTHEIDNFTPPVEDNKEVIGFTRPLQETERKMLMSEIDNLRSERHMVNTKLIETEAKLKRLQLSTELLRENDEKCKFYTGLSWEMLHKTISFLESKLTSRRRGNVPALEQYFITLVKLRQNPKFEYLAISATLE